MKRTLSKDGETGWIFDVKRFSIHDGPGIRTTVFLNGCPLRCMWCDNPESQHIEPRIVFWEDRCIVCGACLEVCTRSAIVVDKQGRKSVLPSRCDSCGRCVDQCYANALEQVGRIVTIEEVMSLVEADALFYQQSKGGVTLSGGEPTVQAAFSQRILEASQERGIHTTMETCGYAPWKVWESLLPNVNLILYDVKETDAAKHRTYTGVSNDRILKNLRRIARAGKHVIVRRPVIPGCNDTSESILALARLMRELDGVDEVHLLPYHRLGESKYRQLKRDYPMGDQPPLSSVDVQELRDIMVSCDLACFRHRTKVLPVCTLTI